MKQSVYLVFSFTFYQYYLMQKNQNAQQQSVESITDLINAQQEMTHKKLIEFIQDTFRDLPIEIQFFCNMVLYDIGPKNKYNKNQVFAIKNKVHKWVTEIRAPQVKFLNHKLIIISENKQTKQQLIRKVKQHNVISLDYYQSVNSFTQKYKQDITEIQQLSQMKGEGYYYLNTYVTHLNKIKHIQLQENKSVRKLLQHIWNFDFNAAEIECKKTNSIQSTLLQPILKGFSNIELIITKDKEMSKDSKQLQGLDKIFHHRNTFNVSILQNENYSFKLSSSVNILCTELTEIQLNQILSLSLSKKTILVKENIEFLRNLSNKIKSYNFENDYFKLIFIFLGNCLDRKQYLYKQILELPAVHQIDKYILSSKFVHYSKAVEYQRYIKEKLQKSDNLYNLVLCDKPKQYKKIMQNYLDQTHDLRTIAYLSLYYQKQSNLFDKYIYEYKQILKRTQSKEQQLMFLQKQEELNYNYNAINRRQQKKIQSYEYNDFFLNKFNLEGRKSLQIRPRQKYKDTCSICSIEINISNSIDNFYIQCQKCNHGGHSKHILSWFEKNERCAKSDCICLCN